MTEDIRRKIAIAAAIIIAMLRFHSAQAGDLPSVTYRMPDFSSITCDTPVALIVFTQCDGMPEVRVESPVGNLTELYSFEVRDDVLFITPGKYMSDYAKDRTTVYIMASSLEMLTLNADTSFICERLYTDKDIIMDFAAGGNVRLSDVLAHSFSLIVRGTPDVTVGRLMADNVSIDLLGGGTTVFSGILADNMSVSGPGAGILYVAGDCETVSYFGNHSGVMNCRELRAADVFAKMGSTGTLFCTAMRSLDASTPGGGTVVYYGEPEVMRIKGNIVRGSDMSLTPATED